MGEKGVLNLKKIVTDKITLFIKYVYCGFPTTSHRSFSLNQIHTLLFPLSLENKQICKNSNNSNKIIEYKAKTNMNR